MERRKLELSQCITKKSFEDIELRALLFEGFTDMLSVIEKHDNIKEMDIKIVINIIDK
jgi:hypothetical protein